MKVLVMIPAYNEADAIADVVCELTRTCPQFDYIVVNDCSTDSTREILSAAQYNHLNLANNLGIGGSVQSGFLYARANGYDAAVQLDGDGQHDPAYIEKLLVPLQEGQADLVIGSRFVTGEGFQSTGARRAGIRFLSGLIRLCCGARVKDVTSGFRAFNRQCIELFSKQYAQDYPEPEAIIAAKLNGLRLCETPVQMRERSGGVSSIRLWSSIYYMVKVSLAILLYRFTFRKEL